MTGVDKRFGQTAALNGFDVEVPIGDLLALLGPSGSGKTTALRVIAGFERPDAGTVEVGGRLVEGRGLHIPPERRRVGMVFQDYALFSHLTVAENIGYGVEAAHRPSRVAEVLELVGLAGLERRLPHELSGGQQQRVALARALAPRPAVILLDEPFSNLDASLRQRVRRELKSILGEARTTALFVTHDQEEALSVSDHVAVMREGRVVQTAPPPELYRHPADSWVAGFLGEADFLSGVAAEGVVETPVGRFRTELTGPVIVMLRPEHVVLTPDAQGPAMVADREYFGHDQLVTVVLAGGLRIRSRLGPGPDFRPGDRVIVKVAEVLTYAV
ncbi:MAG TPA: ABC transporter ATP-binding protein [Acidimicrobiia bacterium]|nr:ABC transporter ATP-binding protein [Acidimicrobiia bacterium]